MELLRQTALSLYEEYENSDVGGAGELKIARVRAHGETSCPATYEIQDAYEANLLSRISFLSSLACPDDDKSETASLLLVCMNTFGGLGISKTSFLDLIDALGIDRSVLQPIVSNVFGFVEFSEGKGTSTYFLADAQMKLMWSYNFATPETKAILIVPRAPPNFQRKSQHVLTDLLASLRQQRENIFNPYTLLFISLVRMAARECNSNSKPWMLQRLPEQKTTLEKINSAITKGTELVDLAVPVRHIEGLTASLASEERKMDIVDSLLDALSDRSTWHHQFRISPIGIIRRLELCEKDMDVFAAVVRPIRQQVAASRSAAKYTAARAQGQSQLIRALRAQEESRLNREMAQASRDLAESARRDTASMKTIAVMTMAFLPGTFFAALFSVPELRWDHEIVVGDRFWVYWVFTLPVTAFVFLIWMVLSYDDGFKSALGEYQRRKRTDVGKDGLREA